MEEQRPDSRANPDPHPPPPVMPRPVLPLDYSEPGGKPRGSFGSRFAIGFFGYLAFSAAWFFMSVSRQLGGAIIFGAWAAATAALLLLALFLRLRYGYSGVGYGIGSVLLLAVVLIGGLVLLVIGICSGVKF